jgi:hypothetical protein
MKIGFTGTRHGISNAQKKAFKNLLAQLKEKKEITEFHHGDCIGSDEQVHKIVKSNNDKTKVVIHPPSYNCKGDISLKTFPYLDRNHNIVDNTDILIATPDTLEKLHSGTWATIRYARKQKKEIYIIKSSGKIEKENP